MKTLKIFPLFALIFINATYAQPSINGFMTPKDIMHHSTQSNINLHNNRSSNLTVYGLYLNRYAYVTPGQTCDSATIIFSGNVTAGAVATPIAIPAGKSVSVGSNYLYNMILGAIYYENIIIPFSPPGCALPGCTWGSDTVKYNWCIYLGALAPVVTTSGYTSALPPYTDAASGGGYDYNLISSFTYLGPISCDDQTLSCNVVSSQTQNIS